MEEIVKWCITAVSAMLPAITIYFVVNVLSWKPKKKAANKNEIAQPRQYFWIFVGSTVLWSAMSLFALFLPEEMDANDSSLFGCIFSLVFALFSLLGTIWVYRWRIVMDKKSFTFSSLFRRTRTYQYSEVQFRNFNNHFRVYYKGKYLFTVMYEMDNSSDFWWAIAKNKSSDDNQNDEIH